MQNDSAQRLQQLNEISQTLISSSQEAELYPLIINSLPEIIPADHISVWHFLADVQELELVAFDGLIPKQLISGTRLSLAQIEFASDLDDNAAKNISLIDKTTDGFVHNLKQVGLNNALNVPLIIQDQLLGWLLVGSAQSHAYQEQDVQLLNQVASIASLIIHNHTSLQKAEKQRNIVNTIRSSGDTLLTVINDILDFSKIEANKLDLELMPFDIAETIEEVIQLLKPTITAKGISISCTISEKVSAWILQDITRVRQVLSNLLSNAEDNVVKQKVALGILRKLGYSADVAANGIEVLEALQRQSYDVVLMDIQMPEMDGVTATKHIRSQWPADKQPYIIALTANAMDQQRDEYLAAGMDDFVSKPIRLPELINALIVCE